MNYGGNTEQNKKLFKIIIVSGILILAIVGFIVYRLVILREIVIEEKTIQMIPGGTYTIEFTTKPKSRKNDKFIWTTNNEKAISVNNGIITAIGEGDARVWIKSKANPDVFTTVDVVVKTKITRFREKLIKNFGYEEVDKDKVKLDNYYFDTTNKTFQYLEHDKTYTLYYYDGYFYVLNSSSYDTAEFYYYIDSGQLSCSGSREESCSQDTLIRTQETINLMISYFKNYLGREYTIGDI